MSKLIDIEKLIISGERINRHKLIEATSKHIHDFASSLSKTLNTEDSDRGAFDTNFCSALDELILQAITEFLGEEL